MTFASGRTHSGPKVQQTKILLCTVEGCPEARKGKYWKFSHTFNGHIVNYHGNHNMNGEGEVRLKITLLQCYNINYCIFI